MRLSSDETSAILEVLQKYLPPSAKAQVFLFGSRTQDHLFGGDIDLAVVFDEPLVAQKVSKIDYQIFADLKSQPAIGDQKIDLKIISTADAENAFFKNALANAVLLMTR